MEDKLLKTVTDELCKHFNDPIDIECSYCEAAKAVIPIIRAEAVKDVLMELQNLSGVMEFITMHMEEQWGSVLKRLGVSNVG